MQWVQVKTVIQAFFSFVVLLGLSAVHVNAAGYRLLEHDGFMVHVWYPTDTPPEDGRMGPFDVVQAVDAPVRAGSHQIVLVSHGFNGRSRNHHLTAQALADAGFIALAPMHAADHYIDTDKRAEALVWRADELRHAVELLFRQDGFRGAVDLSQIHGIGYSLGTVTIMMGAGAGFDLALVNEHCEMEDDPTFCEWPSFFTRLMRARARGIEVIDPERDIPDRFFGMPFINGRVALIAPIAKGVLVEDHLFIAQKAFVLGIADDRINLVKYHSLPYRGMILPDRLDRLEIHDGGNHSAFIAPFAKRVTDIEHIDAAIDPPGFDRRAFLDRLNGELVSFLKTN